MSTERKCKGSMLVDLVKIVSAAKGLPWDKYLKPEDFEVVKTIMPSAWYPIECFQRLGLAVFDLVAGGSRERVELFGRAAMKELWEGPYRPFLDKHDPFEATQKFLDLRKAVFNFSKMELEKTGPSSLRVKISELGDFPQGLDLFLILTGVHFRELVALNGGANPNLATSQTGPESNPVLLFDLVWEGAANA